MPIYKVVEKFLPSPDSERQSSDKAGLGRVNLRGWMGHPTRRVARISGRVVGSAAERARIKDCLPTVLTIPAIIIGSVSHR
ncbi:hypothetical protein, partial [Rhodopseudomonas palustris]|uniref:hypothetical protein n=1 Tax=Rhodopseudomonas palustris TaxID=1076 RepID=UPI001AEC2C1B